MSQSVRLCVSVAILLAALSALQFRSAGEAVQLRKAFETFPSTIGTWKEANDAILDPGTLGMLRLSDYLMRRYVDSAGHSMWLYMGYWQSQRRGSDIHSPKNCLPAGGWEPIEASRLIIPVGGPTSSITVNHYLIQKDRQLQVVIYWFEAQGTVVAGELDAKIQMVRSAILKNRTDGALIRLSSPVTGSVQDTTDRMVEYVRTFYPVVREYLPG
jgi:EpsI family protein